jgi:rhodanese-related sulfurtransferase
MTTDTVRPEPSSVLSPTNVSAHDAAGAAAEFFAAKLRHEIDPSDIAAGRAAGERFILLDVRDATGWDQGHIPGAVHFPRAEILARLDELPPIDEDPPLVVYCWGPGCNGSTKAALVLAEAGYRNVRDMIGGFEYWTREGLSIVTATGRSRRPVDDLTGPLPKEPIGD